MSRKMEMEMKQVHRIPLVDCEYIERPIYQNDSLQSISIRYRVPITELRRLNGITTDLDFHALRTIKIPAIPFGPLWNIIQAETIPEDRRNPSTNDADQIQSVLKSADETLANSKLIQTTPTAILRSNDNNNNSSGGIKTLHLVCIVLGVAVVAPAFYLYCYLTSKPSYIGN
ncbi:hypothetical protein ACOME3_000153 [Neoechinorhynchus agilis]